MFGLSRLGISSHGIIVCFLHLTSAGYRAAKFALTDTINSGYSVLAAVEFLVL